MRNLDIHTQVFKYSQYFTSLLTHVLPSSAWSTHGAGVLATAWSSYQQSFFCWAILEVYFYTLHLLAIEEVQDFDVLGSVVE